MTRRYPLPTPLPTPEICPADISISCTDENNVPCDDLFNTAEYSCLSGTDILSLSLEYTGSSCTDPNTAQQRGKAAIFCADSVPPDQIPPLVDIQCLDATDGAIVYFSGTGIAAGSPVSLSPANNNDGSTLPRGLITCVVTNPTNDETVQTVTVDLSGQFSLVGGDVLGAFRLVRCSDSTGPLVQCDRPVRFNYAVTNIGAVPTTVSGIERTRSGETLDLTGQAAPAVSPGETTTAVEPTVLDICGAVDISTSAVVVGKPLPEGVICADSTTLRIVGTRPPVTAVPSAAPAVGGRISGTVFVKVQPNSALLRPEPNAIVELSGFDGTVQQSTDANGEYEFVGLADGIYQVKLLGGDKTFQNSIDMSSGVNNQFTLTVVETTNVVTGNFIET